MEHIFAAIIATIITAAASCIIIYGARAGDVHVLFSEDMYRIEHTLASTKLGSSEAAELIEAAGYAANRGRSVGDMIKHLSVNE